MRACGILLGSRSLGHKVVPFVHVLSLAPRKPCTKTMLVPHQPETPFESCRQAVKFRATQSDTGSCCHRVTSCEGMLNKHLFEQSIGRCREGPLGQEMKGSELLTLQERCQDRARALRIQTLFGPQMTLTWFARTIKTLNGSEGEVSKLCKVQEHDLCGLPIA